MKIIWLKGCLSKLHYLVGLNVFTPEGTTKKAIDLNVKKFNCSIEPLFQRILKKIKNVSLFPSLECQGDRVLFVECNKGGLYREKYLVVASGLNGV